MGVNVIDDVPPTPYSLTSVVEVTAGGGTVGFSPTPFSPGPLTTFLLAPFATSDAVARSRASQLAISIFRRKTTGPGPLVAPPTLEPKQNVGDTIQFELQFTDPGVGNTEEWVTRIVFPHSIGR